MQTRRMRCATPHASCCPEILTLNGRRSFSLLRRRALLPKETLDRLMENALATAFGTMGSGSAVTASTRQLAEQEARTRRATEFPAEVQPRDSEISGPVDSATICYRSDRRSVNRRECSEVHGSKWAGQGVSLVLAQVLRNRASLLQRAASSFEFARNSSSR